MIKKNGSNMKLLERLNPGDSVNPSALKKVPHHDHSKLYGRKKKKKKVKFVESLWF